MTKRGTDVLCRLGASARSAVALETTLLLHGIPPAGAPAFHQELEDIVRTEGATPALVGVVSGRATVGVTLDELRQLLMAGTVPKANTSNLGVYLARGSHAATTVSATMEIAASAGVRVFATGGLGGVHQGYQEHLDISADLAAFTRFPVAVVASGVKSILDVGSTRELLETLGVPVIGYQTDRFPAFYRRDGGIGVDARFDDVDELAGYIHFELSRTGRGILIANAIPSEHEIDADAWAEWIAKAKAQVQAQGKSGRDATPALLGALHEISGGATLRANLALVKSNAALAGRLAARLHV